MDGEECGLGWCFKPTIGWGVSIAVEGFIRERNTDDVEGRGNNVIKCFSGGNGETAQMERVVSNRNLQSPFPGMRENAERCAQKQMGR